MCRDDGDGDLWKSLPKLPRIVGGRTDILIGLKYKKYFPQQIHMFPSGLTVYRSLFEGSDRAIGVIGGQHPEFTNAARHHRATNFDGLMYFQSPIDQYGKRFWLECEVPLLGYKTLTKCDLHIAQCKLDNSEGIFLSRNKPLKCIKVFDESENAGTEISYRCIYCKNCRKCKKCPRLDAVTIQEEIEQGIIDCNVNVDIVRRVTTAALPFVTNPD